MKKTFFILTILTLSINSQSLILDVQNMPQESKSESFENNSTIFSMNKAERKNPALAIFYSFLLPGMGELYAGGFDSGKYFTIAEATLWGVFTGFKLYAYNRESSYKSYAQVTGGVNLNDKNEDYFANVGLYGSLTEYNNDMALKRRFSDMYNPATHNWDWNTGEERKIYRDMWLSSETANNNIRFVVGAMLVNRVISIINAIRVTARHNNSLEEQQSSWNIYMDYSTNPEAISNLRFNFITAF